jgi:hypothetical protein
MNFFGHAVVASWTSVEPAFVLGAMVPDFANMVGARVPGVTHEEIARGVAYHHETDRVFHDAPTFKKLMADARRDLRARELPRPSALAVGHIGVEILLDASLARDDRGRGAYLDAIRAGDPSALGVHLSWDAEPARDRYGLLVSALVDRGVPRSAADPDAVAFRVRRALSRRPRLALTEGGEHIVRAWAESAADAVAAAAPVLVAEIVAGLGRPSV